MYMIFELISYAAIVKHKARGLESACQRLQSGPLEIVKDGIEL